jgi:hypothetical protein
MSLDPRQRTSDRGGATHERAEDLLVWFLHAGIGQGVSDGCSFRCTCTSLLNARKSMGTVTADVAVAA